MEFVKDILIAMSIMIGFAASADPPDPCQNFQGYACGGICEKKETEKSIIQSTEQTILDQMNRVLSNKTLRPIDSRFEELFEFYEECLTTNKTDFYKSSLVDKIISVCGGESIFREEAAVEIDLSTVLLQLQNLFHANPMAKFTFNGRIDITQPSKEIELTPNFIKKVLGTRKFSASVGKKVFEFQNEIDFYPADYDYQRLSDWKIELDSILEPKVNWYGFIEAVLFGKNRPILFEGAKKDHNDPEISMSFRQIETFNRLITVYGQKVTLAYLCLASLKMLEQDLAVAQSESSGDEDSSNFYSKDKCSELAYSAQLPAYSLYFGIFGKSVPKRELEEMIGAMKQSLITLLEKSSLFKPKQRGLLVDRVKMVKMLVAYPDILFNRTLIDKYMKELKLKDLPSLFEKSARIAATDFTFTMQITMSKTTDDYVWFHDGNLNHVLRFSRPKSEPNLIVLKAGLLEQPYFDASSPKYSQMLTWKIASYLVHIISEPIDQRVLNGRSNFQMSLNTTVLRKIEAWCRKETVLTMDKVDEIILQNFETRLVLAVFEKYHQTLRDGSKLIAKSTRDELQKMFTLNAKRLCDCQDLNNEDVDAKLTVLSLSSQFSEAFKCQVGSKMNPTDKFPA